MHLPPLPSSVFRAVNTVVRPLLDLGIGNPLPIGGGPVVVESTGRESGELRRTPLLSIRLGDTIAVSTIRSRSDWMANLQAEPHARLRLFGRDRDVTSQFLDLSPLRVALLHLDPAEPC
jgi:hypothetical protein